MTTRRLSAIAIGVPARNEAGTIRRCIEALARAVIGVDVPVHLTIAADRCRDDTVAAAVAASGTQTFATFSIIETAAGRAGAARDLACCDALRAAARTPSRERSTTKRHLWLATTDADTLVPADWLRMHLAHAERGVHGVAGLVDLDPEAPAPLDQWFRTEMDRLGTGQGHPHVHGANLGLRADWFERAGGFPHLVVGEDQALWRALHLLGARLRGVTDLRVLTSARLDGRAPDGFATFLSRAPVSPVP